MINRRQAEISQQVQRSRGQLDRAVGGLVAARPGWVRPQAPCDYPFGTVARMANRSGWDRPRLQRAQQQQRRELHQVVSLREVHIGRDAVGIDQHPALSSAFQHHSGLSRPVRDSANGLLQVSSLHRVEIVEVEHGIIEQDPHDAVAGAAA